MTGQISLNNYICIDTSVRSITLCAEYAGLTCSFVETSDISRYRLCIMTSNSVDLDVSLWLLQWGLVCKDCSLLRLPQSVDLDFPCRNFYAQSRLSIVYPIMTLL
jgi:hypothetical protein